MKKNSGITLIALVITIIVLLILAGVALAMIAGNDGILGKANKAKTDNELGAAKDEINLTAVEALHDYYASLDETKSYVAGDADLAIAKAIVAKTLSNSGITKTVTDSATSPVTVAASTASVTTPVNITITMNGRTVTGELQNSKITWGTIDNVTP